MLLKQLLKRVFAPRSIVEEQLVQDRLIWPPHRTLSRHLHYAAERQADAMSIGTPLGKTYSRSDEETCIRREADAEIKKRLSGIEPLGFTCKGNTQLRPETEGIDVPIWLKVEDRWECLLYIDATVYLRYLAAITERLVSLDGSQGTPQPVKWIEFTDPQVDEGRRFFEVTEILYQSNQTLVLQFGEIMTTEKDVHAARYATGRIPISIKA